MAPVSGPGVVGLTGFEPVTPRLSSVCSNQLSYRPEIPPSRARLSPMKSGGKETRTPDILLAKQALYQLSYAPGDDHAISFGHRKGKGKMVRCTIGERH